MKSNRPHYVAGDMMRMPFADGSFDCVTCGWVLEHLPDPKPGLADVARVPQTGWQRTHSRDRRHAFRRGRQPNVGNAEPTTARNSRLPALRLGSPGTASCGSLDSINSSKWAESSSKRSSRKPFERHSWFRRSAQAIVHCAAQSTFRKRRRDDLLDVRGIKSTQRGKEVRGGFCKIASRGEHFDNDILGRAINPVRKSEVHSAFRGNAFSMHPVTASGVAGA